MAKTYGYNTKVRLNGNQALAIASGSVQFRSDTHDITDTETAVVSGGDDHPGRERGVGLGEAELTLTLFSDPNVNIHAIPYSFRSQQRISLIEIFVNGLANNPDRFINVLIDDVTKDPVGDPNQPNRIRIHGFCKDYNEAGTF